MATSQANSPPTSTTGPNNGIRGDYQRVDTTLTLREGLAEYYRVNPGLSEPANIKKTKSATWFQNHDCTHVIFGTHTGILDESINDMLTIFGVDVSLRDYAIGFFATDESKAIAKTFPGTLTLFKIGWFALKLVPTIWRKTKKMAKKWPWHPPESFLDRPIRELREEFGIVVFRPAPPANLAEQVA